MSAITNDLINELEDLQDELANIVCRISELCDEVDDKYARNYLIAGMEIAVESGDWMSRNYSLPQWIKDLKDRLVEEGEETELDADTMFDILQNGVK